MKRLAFLVYSVLCYLLFLAIYAWMAAFVGNFYLPVTLDAPREGPLISALAIDLGLILIFAVQHSVMPRPWFKKWLTRYIPEPIERSTYVLASCICLVPMLLFWQPIGGVIWDVQNTTGRAVLWGLFALGWLSVPVATLMLNHFDLLGLRQAWLAYRNKDYRDIGFRKPWAYRYVRHPIYVAWIIAFWATPTMTVSHLVFALGLTLYILVAIPLEERDLIRYMGDDYRNYRKQVPALFPRASLAKPAKAKL